jgi:hypothetical protein
MIMLEENYPSESWVRVYTDGSATMLKRKEGLVYTFSIPMESSNHRQYLQAYTVPTTKPKGKPSFMMHIPSSAKLTTTLKSYS